MLYAVWYVSMSSKAARSDATNSVQVGKAIPPVVSWTCGWNHSMAEPDRKDTAYAILALSALTPVYRSRSELNIRLSCIMNDLYSDRVPSNDLGGLSFGAWSLSVVGVVGMAGTGAPAPSRWRIPLARLFW